MKKLLTVLLCLFATTPIFAAIVTKKQVKVDTKNFYTINIEYPYLTHGKNTASANGFNQAVQQFNNNEIAKFKKSLSPAAQLKKMASRIKKLSLNANSNALYIRYKLLNNARNVVSVRFAISTSHYGAAHPTQTSTTLNYALKANKALALKDLFRPNSNYLQVLSNYSRKALVKKIIIKGPHNPNIPLKKLLSKNNPEYSMIMQGTAPIAKNYRFWNISPQGFSITFPTYQVAPYYFGPQTVVIPNQLVSKLIKKNSPIAGLIKVKE